MAVAGAKGKQPKLTGWQQVHLVESHSIADPAELFSVSRATVHRVLERARPSRDGHS